MKDGIVSKKHANLFLNFSWLFFFNYLYALYKDLPDLAICTSGLVWFTTILAWTANEIGIYRYKFIYPTIAKLCAHIFEILNNFVTIGGLM